MMVVGGEEAFENSGMRGLYTDRLTNGSSKLAASLRFRSEMMYRLKFENQKIFWLWAYSFRKPPPLRPGTPLAADGWEMVRVGIVIVIVTIAKQGGRMAGARMVSQLGRDGWSAMLVSVAGV